MYMIALYPLNYYENKYFISLFAHFEYKAKIYAYNFTHFIKNKHKYYALLYIRINTQKYT